MTAPMADQLLTTALTWGIAGSLFLLVAAPSGWRCRHSAPRAMGCAALTEVGGISIEHDGKWTSTWLAFASVTNQLLEELRCSIRSTALSYCSFAFALRQSFWCVIATLRRFWASVLTSSAKSCGSLPIHL